MAGSGQIVLDAGPFPGVSDAEFTITGLTGIADSSRVEAWIQPADTTAGFQADGFPFIVFPGGLERGANLGGIAASKLGIFSAFINVASPGIGGTLLANDAFVSLLNSSLGISFTPFSGGFGGTVSVYAQGATGVDVDLQGPIRQVPTGFAHVLASWDIGANVGWLYLNDVLVDSAINRSADEVIDYTLSANWAVGSQPGSQGMSGVLAEVYFAPGQYLDFSVQANRRKFNQIAGDLVLPVTLGAGGATPTGVQPIVYQRLDGGEAAAAFKTNRGTGGNFEFSPANTAKAYTPSFGQPAIVQPGHSLDEHIVDPPNVRAYSPSTAAASMKVRLSSRDVELPIGTQNANSPLLCGKWNVGYAWA